MPLHEIGILAAMGFLGGVINALVGGGTFFTFPILLAFGLPPIVANATNTVALWPGIAMSARAYILELRAVREKLPARCAVAIVGGAIGAILLLASGNEFFNVLIPWLIGIATLLFAFSNGIVRQISKFGTGTNAALVPGLGLVFAVYGGYFGAGVGILLMAALTLAGESNTQIANAQKNFLSSLINGMAVIIFVVQGAVIWSYALVVMAGAIPGGYFGARAARVLPKKWLRICVISVGTALTIIYFQRVYFP
jgi:uncharacterized membrane protein YfcA